MDENISKLIKLVDNLERDLYHVKRLLSDIEKSGKPNYKELPGITGSFDGFYLIPESGEKIEVPQNYSAKSRLVYGDTLKVIEEDGKKLFKQIAKVPRKRVDGIVNKKDGKWYVLADTGSYRLNDAAVDFNNLNVNDKITVTIPEDNISAPFATLEKVPERSVKVEEAKFTPSTAPVKKPTKPKVPAVTKTLNLKKETKVVVPKTPKTKEDASEGSKEFVDQLILGDDDLR